MTKVEPLSTVYSLANSVCTKLYGEYGYPTIENTNVEIYADDRLTKVIWLSPNNAPFIELLFPLDEDDRIIDSFENYINNDTDALCSVFALFCNNDFTFHRKNNRTNQLERCNDIPIYKSITKIKISAIFEKLSENFENVFFESHSFLRDIDGLHPDEALDELCKIIYAKLYDEDDSNNKNSFVFIPTCYGNYEEYAASIRKLYIEANNYDLRVFSLRVPGYKRSRGVFNERIKLSSLAISKVAEQFAKFTFSQSDIDIKARAFQNIYRPVSRAGMGQYFTPVNVIKFITEAVAPKNTDLVIDPFCGSASFLTESINIVSKSVCTERQLTDFIFYKLHGIEKSERMVRLAMTDMRLHGDGHSNIRCTDALLPFENYYDIEPNSFDIIMTNPPFGSVLTSEVFKYLGNFELCKNKKSTPLEVLGLERCIQLLRDGGKLAIVLPESIFVNKTFLYVRKWLQENTRIIAIISLPAETFSPFGTNIKTSVLFCSKCKREGAKTYKVFTGGIDNIGYDSTGKLTNDDDWKMLLSELKNFIAMEVC